jgi:hypothetical protein
MISSQEIFRDIIDENNDLSILNQRINELNEIIKNTDNYFKRGIFVFQNRFWQRELNEIRNVPERQNGQTMTDALIEAFSERIIFLESVILDTDLIFNEASRYTYINPFYLMMFKNDYIGKEIKIFGALTISDTNYPTNGIITGVEYGDRAVIPVVFSRMTENQLNFILQNNPISHHSGKVEIRDDKIYFYITRLLGVEL